MQTATTNFLDCIKSAVRTIYGRVIIEYTNSNVDASIETSASETANVSYVSQVANGVLTPTRKYISLDGSATLDGTYYLAPSVATDGEMGWWGKQLSSTADRTFAVTYPLLTQTFLARPIRTINAVGDDKRQEWAVDFEIKLYQTGNVLVHTETVTNNWYPFLGVTNWTAVNTGLSAMQTWEVLADTIGWEKDITQENDVVKATLEITKWSHTGRQAKILEFYKAIQETYEGDDIIDFTVTEERDISNGSLPIGNISANEIAVRINNINNRFDAGNTASATYGLLKPNRRIRAWIGCKLPDDTVEYIPMGIFWSGDWETPEKEVYASTTGLDLLEKMRNTTYTTSEVAIDTTLYTLAETVLQDYGLTAVDYSIDTELQNYTVSYAWFNPVSHREALRQIVEACAGQAYVDRSGILQVQGPSFLDATTAALTLTLDHIWDKSNPVKWSEVANYVRATVKPLTPATVLSAVYTSLSDLTLSAGGTKTYTIQYNVVPCMSAIASISAILTATTTIVTADTTYYAWGANIKVQNTATSSDTFKLIVNALSLTEENKGTMVSQDSDSISENGKLVYTVPENNLIQTLTAAQTLTDKILSVFKDPRRDITINWRGNPALELADRITAPDYRDQSTQDYFVVRQTHEFDGGLSSTLNGRVAS